MGSCCDPNAPKNYMLNVGGTLVGLIAVEQAFLDVKDLELTDDAVADKLLDIVKRRNYIPDRAEMEYKVALHASYKNYLAAREP